MKNLIAQKCLSFGLVLSAALPAASATLNCTLTETLDTKVTNRTTVKYEIAGRHSWTPWENSFGNGFVTVSQGYTVINILTKDGHVFNFHGKYNAGDIVGGSTCLADMSTCLEVECK